MPRLSNLGYRYLKTVEANAAKFFERLHLSGSPRAILSKIPLSKHDEIRAWSEQIIESAQKGSSPLSPNIGQIVAVKDNFVTSDLPTTCASNILAGFQAPAPSTVCQILEDHGMKIVAKTNMDEFGMGSYSTNSSSGAVQVITREGTYSAGGSSGGSALAVLYRLAHSAIGSDTGGSVRLPAAYTGIVGFKPSYGRISRYGLIPYANSLDTVGIMAKTVLDVFLLYEILEQCDPKDPTCLTVESRNRIQVVRNERMWSTKNPTPDNLRLRKYDTRRELPFRRRQHSTDLRRRLPRPTDDLSFRITQPRRIGVPTEYNIHELHPLVLKAWMRTLSILSAQGHEIVPISLPLTKQALAAYYVLAPAEASSNLAKYDGVRYGDSRSPVASDDAGGTLYATHRSSRFGDEVKRRILLGTFSLSAGAMDNYFIQAQKVRRLVQDDFNQVFRMPHPFIEGATGIDNGVDLIVCPTVPSLPPLIVELAEQTPLDSYINDVFTVPASLAGLPAISIPVLHSDDALAKEEKIGMQIIGQYGDDISVVNFAREYVEPLRHRPGVKVAYLPTSVEEKTRWMRI